jgi:VWFA-related protein
MGRVVGLALLVALAGWAAVKVQVTVVEEKSGRPITDLTAADFLATDAERPRTVEAAEFRTTPVDTLLMVDTSLVGQAVQGAAVDLIAQLREKEQMALVGYHSSADLIQDFTSSPQTLQRALSQVKYGNKPRALDAIYAAADEGFTHAVLRKAILLLTTGFEGSSRVTEREVIQVCRRQGISIYVLYLSGRERGLFQRLARATGGAAFSLADLGKATQKPAERVFEVMRGNYTLTLSGNLGLSDKFRLELKRPGKYFISAMALD